MLRTIKVGSAVSIQGLYVKALPDGRIVVNLSGTNYTGLPVTQAA